jgi:2-polyprenyl-3-methyl-5-hydroxy-6-metoxy-1,4-benzoquinol methylase
MIDEYKKIGNSYKSKVFGNPQDIYTDNYWSTPIRSSIDEQVSNVVDKNRLVIENLSHIEPKMNLEIACSPGILLGEMCDLGFECIGIEVDEKYKEQIQKYSKDAELHFGFFPEITKRWNKGWDANQFSNIIALDVFEHIEDSIGFLSECNWLMVKGGHLIIQSPIILEDGQMDDKMFNGLEHIWIYGIQDLHEIFQNEGFKIIDIQRHKVGHEQITAIKL